MKSMAETSSKRSYEAKPEDYSEDARRLEGALTDMFSYNYLDSAGDATLKQ